jgi:hypothetical protein
MYFCVLVNWLDNSSFRMRKDIILAVCSPLIFHYALLISCGIARYSLLRN